MFKMIGGMIPDDVYDQLGLRGHHIYRVRALGNANALKLIYNEEGELIDFEGAADRRGEGIAEVIRVNKY